MMWLTKVQSFSDKNSFFSSLAVIQMHRTSYFKSVKQAAGAVEMVVTAPNHYIKHRPDFSFEAKHSSKL